MINTPPRVKNLKENYSNYSAFIFNEKRILITSYPKKHSKIEILLNFLIKYININNKSNHRKFDISINLECTKLEKLNES